ncbi:uncharacterized protein kcnk4a isoform X1 [Nelusetta ayraudi]|uniref:uncharacterized protein kcnk4a isoform X1 n=1 Tax=Nelusetta ayraudi TaxID=303726 RepID=UPI003F708FE4
MRCPTLLALLTGVILYLVMGALVFSALESPNENKAYEKLLDVKHTFLGNETCVTELDFLKLVKEVKSAVEAGLDVTSLSENVTSHWDMSSAAFFCGTIITTIGFGNMSPRTKYGQLFCVCYALVGIPMFGILLAGVGDQMGTILRRAVSKIENFFLVRMKRKVKPTTVRVISAVLSILLGCLVFLALPALFFQKMEEWSFLESLYFVVITLTTVGFGDYVPGGGHNSKYFKLLVLTWIVFGLAYFASILTMIANWLRVLSKKTRAEMEELRAHATDWTQNIQNMSKDFRIPNPLEFNDPFLLQRRRWKRSERRRMRRGAQVTLGHWARGGSTNGHLPNRWPGLSNSMSQLETHSSLERLGPVKVAQGNGAGVGTIPRAVAGLKLDAAPAGLQMDCRMLPHLLARSFSVPVARSTLELDSGSAVQDGSLSGFESPYESGSDTSSIFSSLWALHKMQPRLTVSSVEQGRAKGASSAQEKSHSVPYVKYKSGSSTSLKKEPAPDLLHHPSLPSFISSSSPSCHPVVLPSFPLHMASSANCQLLDFFGENLAYIDESSDTMSDRVQPAASEERRRKPRKPRRSMRRHVSDRLRTAESNNMRPPSNPPTPPPDSSESDDQRGEPFLPQT